MPVPDLADVLAARQRSRRTWGPTPLYSYPSLDALTGAQLRVKHENHQPVGAFKVRGGINLVSQLSPAEREAGVISASTGNHGQSVAYAAHLFGVRAIICMPEQANPVKVESMQALGAEVVFHGARLRRRPRALREAGRRARLPVRPLRERGRADRRRGHLHAGDARGPARHRRDRGPGRRRQRAAGVVRRGQGRPPVDRGDRRAVRGRARPPTGPGGPASWSPTPPPRSPRGWPPGRRSSCRSGSCARSWTTSSWSPRTPCAPRRS